MKKLIYILLLLPLLVACGSDSDDSSVTQKERFISIKINDNVPLSDKNNLIGVQIYKGESPIAFGIFDNTYFPSFLMEYHSNYTIKILVIINGKLDISKDADGYIEYFQLSNGKGASVTNKFISTSDQYLSNLSKTSGAVTKNKFYGEINYPGNSKYEPEVDLIQQVFGIRFNVTFEGSRIEPDDCMYMAVDGAPDTLFIYAKDVEHTIEAMYTFNDFSGEIPFNINLSVYHRLSSGTERRLSGTSGGYLSRNSLMILDQTCSRTSDMDSYPYQWDAIYGYYGDRGI